MRNKLSYFLVVMLGLLACLSIIRFAHATPHLIDQLMRKSGIDKQLEQQPRMVLAVFLQAKHKLKSQGYLDQEIEEFLRLIKVHFKPRKLKNIVKKYLKTNIKVQDIENAINWLDSPLGRKLTKLEEESSSPEAFAESKIMADELLGDVSRVDLIKRLDRVFGLIESGMDASLHTTIAFYTAVAAAYPKETRPSEEDIYSMATHDTEASRPQVERAALVLLLYTYRALSEPEIEKYIAFGDSESGKRYVAVGHTAIKEALVQSTRNLGAEIRIMIKKDN